mmetsp:Transcript_6489/g.15979  ORF Transcript_6489/g.15979 Transcript_6489/m.15979 type:complete len:1470 (+) Transcript_6489:431-4840(+)|eukprot:CAMPEP_0178986962 /NCGR_PEP_ID=MMETSP0795-20121207/2993_1 /TAXON_ID=88552 /ORGANISM="Amoebophrya sp., Strain Ameob2" /LENGTH=1469 /DNA_ID=CAMNT_0020678077 /DNA_START=303 /DNA_END=4712 /DNA_ORIENTATION=+
MAPSKEALTHFLLLCGKGDVKAVSKLIERDSSLAYAVHHQSQQSGLTIACLRGHEELYEVLQKTLHELGVVKKVLDKVDASGSTPLLNAAHACNVKIVRSLLDLGADLHARASNKRNVAHIACTKKEGIQLLRLFDRRRSLEKLLDDQDLWGATPVEVAHSKRLREHIHFFERRAEHGAQDGMNDDDLAYYRETTSDEDDPQPRRPQILLPRLAGQEANFARFPNLTQALIQEHHAERGMMMQTEAAPATGTAPPGQHRTRATRGPGTSSPPLSPAMEARIASGVVMPPHQLVHLQGQTQTTSPSGSQTGAPDEDPLKDLPASPSFPSKMPRQEKLHYVQLFARENERGDPVVSDSPRSPASARRGARSPSPPIRLNTAPPAGVRTIPSGSWSPIGGENDNYDNATRRRPHDHVENLPHQLLFSDDVVYGQDHERSPVIKSRYMLLNPELGPSKRDQHTPHKNGKVWTGRIVRPPKRYKRRVLQTPEPAKGRFGDGRQQQPLVTHALTPSGSRPGTANAGASRASRNAIAAPTDTQDGKNTARTSAGVAQERIINGGAEVAAGTVDSTADAVAGSATKPDLAEEGGVGGGSKRTAAEDPTAGSPVRVSVPVAGGVLLDPEASIQSAGKQGPTGPGTAPVPVVPQLPRRPDTAAGIGSSSTSVLTAPQPGGVTSAGEEQQAQVPKSKLQPAPQQMPKPRPATVTSASPSLGSGLGPITQYQNQTKRIPPLSRHKMKEQRPGPTSSLRQERLQEVKRANASGLSGSGRFIRFMDTNFTENPQMSPFGSPLVAGGGREIIRNFPDDVAGALPSDGSFMPSHSPEPSVLRASPRGTRKTDAPAGDYDPFLTIEGHNTSKTLPPKSGSSPADEADALPVSAAAAARATSASGKSRAPATSSSPPPATRSTTNWHMNSYIETRADPSSPRRPTAQELHLQHIPSPSTAAQLAHKRLALQNGPGAGPGGDRTVIDHQGNTGFGSPSPGGRAASPSSVVGHAGHASYYDSPPSSPLGIVRNKEGLFQNAAIFNTAQLVTSKFPGDLSEKTNPRMKGRAKTAPRGGRNSSGQHHGNGNPFGLGPVGGGGSGGDGRKRAPLEEQLIIHHERGQQTQIQDVNGASDDHPTVAAVLDRVHHLRDTSSLNSSIEQLRLAEDPNNANPPPRLDAEHLALLRRRALTTAPLTPDNVGLYHDTALYTGHVGGADTTTSGNVQPCSASGGPRPVSGGSRSAAGNYAGAGGAIGSYTGAPQQPQRVTPASSHAAHHAISSGGTNKAAGASTASLLVPPVPDAAVKGSGFLMARNASSRAATTLSRKELSLPDGIGIGAEQIQKSYASGGTGRGAHADGGKRALPKSALYRIGAPRPKSSISITGYGSGNAAVTPADKALKPLMATRKLVSASLESTHIRPVLSFEDIYVNRLVDESAPAEKLSDGGFNRHQKEVDLSLKGILGNDFTIERPPGAIEDVSLGDMSEYD